jgi:predicted dithiol-disulfide oxidoreductase (DUF899 family)
LDLPVGLGGGHRLQPRRLGLHRGGTARRQRVQLRHGQERRRLRSVELHGLSAFALEDGIVYHTYSAYDRGTDVLNVDWQLLDRAPRGRGGDFDGWPRRRYEYEHTGAAMP